MTTRGRPAAVVTLTGSEWTTLEKMCRERNRLALRAGVILECATGASNQAVAAQLDLSPQTVSKLRRRFSSHGLKGLYDKPRSGRPTSITFDDVRRLLSWTLSTPPDEAGRWTRQVVAHATGLSEAAVSSVWRKSGVQPAPGVCIDVVPQLRYHGDWSVVGVYRDAERCGLVISVGRPRQRTANPWVYGPPPLPDAGTSSCDPPTGPPQGQVVSPDDFEAFLDRVEAAADDEHSLYLVVDSVQAQLEALIRHWKVGRPRFHVDRTADTDAWHRIVNLLSSVVSERATTCPTHGDGQNLAQALDSSDPQPIKWVQCPDSLAADGPCVCRSVLISQRALPIRSCYQGQISPQVMRKNYWPCRCNGSDCRNCRVRRFYDICNTLYHDWKQAFGAGKALMLTLTYRASESVAPEEWLNRMKRDMRRLRYRWTKDWGAMPPHLWNIHWTARGTPHFHILIPWEGSEHLVTLTRWLRRTWAGLVGLEPGVDLGYHHCAHIRVFDRVFYGIRYMMEYTITPLSKSTPAGTPPHRGRGRSRHWDRASRPKRLKLVQHDAQTAALSPYTKHIDRRIAECSENAFELLQELRGLGYLGEAEAVTRYVQPLRKADYGRLKPARGSSAGLMGHFPSRDGRTESGPIQKLISPTLRALPRKAVIDLMLGDYNRWDLWERLPRRDDYNLEDRSDQYMYRSELRRVWRVNEKSGFHFLRELQIRGEIPLYLASGSLPPVHDRALAHEALYYCDTISPTPVA